MKKLIFFTNAILISICVNAQSKLADVSASDSTEVFKIRKEGINKRSVQGSKLDFTHPTDGKGDTFCIKKTYPPTTKKQDEEFTPPIYSVEKSSLSGKLLKPVEIEGRTITSCLVMFDFFQNDIVVYGFYCDMKLSKKFRSFRERGFYVQRINPETFEVKLTKATDFSEDCIKRGGQILANGEDIHVDGELSSYRLDDYMRTLRECKSDGIYLEAEQEMEKHYANMPIHHTAGTNQPFTMIDMNESIGNILAIKINTDGSLAYTVTIRKSQWLICKSDIPKTNFAYSCTANSAQYILYNDRPENLEPDQKHFKTYTEQSGKGCLVIVKIKADGSTEREIIKTYEKKEGVGIIKSNAHVPDSNDVIFKQTDGTYLKVTLH